MLHFMQGGRAGTGSCVAWVRPAHAGCVRVSDLMRSAPVTESCPSPPSSPLCPGCSGAAQAGVICWALFQVTQLVDGYFALRALPEQYTAHNIAVLVQTVVRGLAYLITFIFGANALGLTGAAVGTVGGEGGLGVGEGGSWALVCVCKGEVAEEGWQLDRWLYGSRADSCDFWSPCTQG